MPMSGSNYVAPTWVNNAPSSLDATELQAMCNTIVQNQGDAAALQAAVSALQSTVSSLTTSVNSKIKVVTRSYVGTGTTTVSISGLSNPQYLIIYCSSYPNFLFFSPCWNSVSSAAIAVGFETGSGSSSTYGGYRVTVSGSSVSIESIGGGTNHNNSGKKYNYLSFSL